MDFEIFAPARDFFYLSALFLGAGFGCILNRFRIKTTTRFRTMTITAGLCFFSGAVAALTAAVICSNWMILKETELFPPMGIVTLIVALAFRFPRAAGFPIFIISGILAVAIGYICLSFPLVENSGQVWVRREGNNLIQIRPVPRGRVSSPEAESTPSISFQAAGEDSVLEFQARCFAFSKIVPLVGGGDRGVITEILGDKELLYAEPRAAWRAFEKLSSKAGADEKTPDLTTPFFSYWGIQKDLELTELPAGAGVTVLFDGPALTFR